MRKLVVSWFYKPGSFHAINGEEVLLACILKTIVGHNQITVRSPEMVDYLVLLLKMPCGVPAKSRATHYSAIYELKSH